MDELDAAAQPRCLECGTVLRDTVVGYQCVTCGLLHLRSESPITLRLVKPESDFGE